MSEENLESQEQSGQENQENIEGLTKEPDKQDDNQDNAKDTNQDKESDADDKGKEQDEIIPETYDFKNVELPNGMELDKELTDEFSKAAKEMRLSQAKADKLMGIGVKLSSKLQDRFNSAFKELQDNQIKSYKTMLNTDPEIGGANLKTTLLEANKAYQTFVSDDAAKILADTGLNNHPAIVKMFRDIGRQVKNDSIRGGNQATHVRTADDWYPSMKKNN